MRSSFPAADAGSLPRGTTTCRLHVDTSSDRDDGGLVRPRLHESGAIHRPVLDDPDDEWHPDLELDPWERARVEGDQVEPDASADLIDVDQLTHPRLRRHTKRHGASSTPLHSPRALGIRASQVTPPVCERHATGTVVRNPDAQMQEERSWNFVR